MRRVLTVLLTAAALAVGACGEEPAEEATPNDRQKQAEATPDQAKSAKAACEKASRKLLDAISTGLEVSGGGGRLSSGHIVKSADFEKVYMVAAEIDGPGLEDKGDVGVWATNSKSANGMVFAVDAVAQEFSDWGDGDKIDAQIDRSSHGVAEAKECAEG